MEGNEKKTPFKALVEKGKASGKLTTQEIDAAMVEMDIDIEELDKLYETLEKLLDYFDISPNDFFGYESKTTITSFENLGQLFIDLGKNFNELANKRKG